MRAALERASMFERYRTALAASGRGGETIRQRVGAVERLQRAYGDPFTVSIAQVDALVEQRRTPESRRTLRTHLSTFYRWAIDTGLTATDPTVSPQLEDASPLATLLQDYRRHLLAAGRAMGTVDQRVSAIGMIAAMHPEILDVTTEQLEEILARRRRTHQAESRRALRSSMQQFYRWALTTGRIPDDPSSGLEPIPVPRKMGRRVPDDAIIQAMKLATLSKKAMLLLGRYAGLRLSEIATLHPRHREGDTLRIRGKGDVERVVPLNEELAEILRRLEVVVGFDSYFFPGRFGGHLHPQSVAKIITRRLGWNTHSLRHGAASAAYRGTGDSRAVQVFLGHASLETTQRYIHIEEDHVRAAANATSIGGSDFTRESAIERAGYGARRGR